MLMRGVYSWLVAIVIALATAASMATIVATSWDFQECIKADGKNAKGGQESEKRVPSVVGTILTYRHCTGAYVIDKKEAITAAGTVIIALFTAILGLFTIRLAGATRVAADAALLNAQAVIDAERAHLFVVIELENIAAMVSNAARAISDGSNYALRISYAFKNYGRTPAIIRAIGHGAIIAPELPQERTLSVVVHLPAHILGDDEKSRPISDIAMPRMTSEIAKSILDLDATFWFYGYVVYDDTFGWRRTLSFVWHYDGGVSEGFTLFRYEETEERRET